MRFFSKIFGALIRKAVTYDIGVLLENYLSSGGIGRTFSARVRNGYKKNGVCFRSVRMVVVGGATIPWILKRAMPNGEEDEVISHPMIQLLKKPNERMGYFQFMERILTHVHLDGRSFVRILRDTRLVPRFLIPLRPSLVSLFDKKNPELGWKYEPPNRRPEVLKPDDVLTLFNYDPEDDFNGMSPLEPAGVSIDQGNRARTWNANLLKRDARPSGLLKSKVKVSKPKRDDMRETFIDKYGGDENAGGPPFIHGDVDFIPTGIPPAKMSWLEGMRLADRTTGVTIGVAPQLLGDKDAATYNNYSEARKALYEETIVPLMVWIVDEVNTRIVQPIFPELHFELNLEAVPAMQENRAETWSRVGSSRWLTIDEKRREAGYEEIGGEAGKLILAENGIVITGDGQVLLSGNLKTLEQIEVPIDTSSSQKPNPVPNPPAAGSSEEPAQKSFSLAPSIFEITTSNRLELYLKQFDREREQYVNSSRLLIQREFKLERPGVLTALKKAKFDAKSIDSAIKEYLTSRESNWRNVYERLFTIVGGHFALKTLREMKKSFALQLETKAPSTDLWVRHVLEKTIPRAGKRIKGINETTREKVMLHVKRGFAKGEGAALIAQRIDAVFLEQIIPNRSEAIARTEITAASNEGNNWAAKSTGLELEKEWVTSRDGRERDTHGAANKQRVAMDEPFTVGGFELMYPGDSSKGAPAAEIVYCRCAAVYHPIGED